MADSEPTFRSLATSFTDFLTVAIHTILYERSVYPQTSFLSARKYNFAVRQSRHPKVCEWINDAVAAVESELFKGAVDRVAVVIYSKNNKPLERYVFEVSRFPKVPASDVDVPLERLDADGQQGSVLPLVDMEEQFRATMNQLAGCSSMLPPIPVGCAFTVAVELKEDGEAPTAHPQPWMPVQPRAPNDGASGNGVVTKPVRAVAAGSVLFETWIEQVNSDDGDG
ncbi:uncharacterized protein LTR77_009061 [Saxophila tyrrhenica]|uniref:HORMA domain-containing protein n=1 Tax=Saxophila tyrrhenica TaxID=1690608 RepID=A0AAV9P3D9_9PEZI|nr:hypothetical protein LTR77_009061 [Saxophila tyrrhenica]